MTELERMRQGQGWSLAELGRELGGVDPTYVGKVLRGERLPSLPVLFRLAKLLQARPLIRDLERYCNTKLIGNARTLVKR